jgi:hypothetical protein
MRHISFLSAALLLLCVAACNKNESAVPGNGADRPLTFNSFVSTTKGELLTTDSITDFGVYAYYTQANAWSASAKPNFMYNQLVSGSKDGGFSYAPLKFWPSLKNARMSFFAYAPYGNAYNGISPRSANTDSGVPRIALSSPDGSCNFQDLVVAEPVYDATLQETGGNITFQFHHTLAKIAFQARLAGSDGSYDNTRIYLNAVQLAAEYPVSGVLDLGNGDWSEVEPGRKRTMGTSLGSGENGLLLQGSRQAVGDDYCILAIPDSQKEFTLSVSYTVVTPDEALDGGKLVNSYTVSQTMTFGTDKGRAYDILLSVGPSAITFGAPEVSAWTTVLDVPGEFTL